MRSARGEVLSGSFSHFDLRFAICDLRFAIEFKQCSICGGRISASRRLPCEARSLELCAPALPKPLVDALPDLLTDYLPNCVIETSGTKWKLPKAGKVALNKAKDGIDEGKLGNNPSALKLTYKAKDGSFKGSFKVYCMVKGKPKAYTVNVTGVLVDGVGYGTAVLKKPACSFPITIK